MSKPIAIPAVSVTYAQAGTSTQPNALSMRPMQERAYQKRGEQYLLIKTVHLEKLFQLYTKMPPAHNFQKNC